MSVKNESHGMSKHRLYRIWKHIKQRCNNPNDQAYRNYGGKGVKVCKEWEESFVAFKDWALSNGYEEHLTIDREDSDGNYEPSNCRWVTRAENTRRARKGRKSAHLVEYKGEKKTLEEWSEELGIKYITLYTRLRRTGSMEKAVNYKDPSIEYITYQGVTKPLYQWAEEIGVKPDTLWQRLYRLHWSVEKALTTKTRAKKR